jgi:hypothetical protein
MQWFSPVSPTNKNDHHDIAERGGGLFFNRILKPFVLGKIKRYQDNSK